MLWLFSGFIGFCTSRSDSIVIAHRIAVDSKLGTDQYNQHSWVVHTLDVNKI